MPRTGHLDSERQRVMKFGAQQFQPPDSGPRSDKVESSAHTQICAAGLKAQKEIITDQEGDALRALGSVLQGNNDPTEI